MEAATAAPMQGQAQRDRGRFRSEVCVCFDCLVQCPHRNKLFCPTKAFLPSLRQASVISQQPQSAAVAASLVCQIRSGNLVDLNRGRFRSEKLCIVVFVCLPKNNAQTVQQFAAAAVAASA